MATTDGFTDDDFVDFEDDYAGELDPDENLTIDEIVQKNISKNIRDLRSFFSSNNFATEKGNQSTNVINVSEKKTYFVPNDHIDELFSILDTCRKEQRMIHYSERQETDTISCSGIMIDFDHFQKSRNVQITDRHFESLTRYITKLLREYIEFEDLTIDDKFTFHIFYIRKPAIATVPTLAGMPTLYKDGFHILIPELQVSKGFKRFLNQELATRYLKFVFKDIELIDPVEKMLDRASANNPVHFLGNSKPGKPAYNLTHAYQITFFNDDDDVDRKLLNVNDLLTGSVKMRADGEPIPINLTYELCLSYYTPVFEGRPTWLKKHNVSYKAVIESKIQVLMEKTAQGIFSDDDLRRDEEDISLTSITNAHAKYVLSLLRILNINYAADYEAWFKVICAIAHCGTTEDYKNCAREFSKRRPTDWNATEFERVWAEATAGRFNRAPVTLGSLRHWAQLSAPQAFAEIEKNKYGNIIRRAAYDNEGRVENANVAKALEVMCGGKFVVDVGQNDHTGKYGYCWYEFVTPGQHMKKGEVYKWRKEMDPNNIHLFIADHLPKVYAQVRDDIKSHKEAAKNEAELKYWNSLEKNFRLSQSHLGSDRFQNGVVKQSQYRFRQRGFYDELDSYEDIIGVGNGILKLGVKPQLIKGFHEYKISKYTEIDYVEFDPENPYIKTLLKAFRDIFPEFDVFNFMLMHASTGLDLCEAALILALLVGGGQNGKSFFAKMVHNTLGNMYCASGKAALLTAPMERGESANSAQMQQKDKRWFYIDEFNKCELLNTARVKMMVSPGWQSGRDLHARQSNFKNTSNTMCLSNFDFIIDTTDHGTWRRIYYYVNKVKFCANPNPKNPWEKKEDTRFIHEYTKDPMYLQAMLSIMVHYNSILRRDYGNDLKRVPVPTIVRETEMFRNRQDALNKFITQMIVKSPKSDAIGTATIASRYIEWYNKNIKNSGQTMQDVQTQLENSRIATSLERRLNGTIFLIGHRLKGSPEEPLQEDESDLVSLIPVEINDTHDEVDNDTMNINIDELRNVTISEYCYSQPCVKGPLPERPVLDIPDNIANDINEMLEGL